MTQSELKQALYDLASVYFIGANIVWGQTKKVEPDKPLVALSLGTVVRPFLPIRRFVDGATVDVYPTTTKLQVDLYTRGKEINDLPGVTGARENTAVDDLMEFVNFLNSAYADDWSYENDITILGNTVTDLTQIANDTSWSYRAMVELDICFTQEAYGYAAIKGITTPSGGGSQELADQSSGWFEQVEITHKEE